MESNGTASKSAKPALGAIPMLAERSSSVIDPKLTTDSAGVPKVSPKLPLKLHGKNPVVPHPALGTARLVPQETSVVNNNTASTRGGGFFASTSMASSVFDINDLQPGSPDAVELFSAPAAKRSLQLVISESSGDEDDAQVIKQKKAPESPGSNAEQVPAKKGKLEASNSTSNATKFSDLLSEVLGCKIQNQDGSIPRKSDPDGTTIGSRVKNAARSFPALTRAVKAALSLRTGGPSVLQLVDSLPTGALAPEVFLSGSNVFLHSASMTNVSVLTSKDGMKLSSLDVVQFALSFIRQALANLAIGKPLPCAAILTLITQALSVYVSHPNSDVWRYLLLEQKFGLVYAQSDEDLVDFMIPNPEAISSAIAAHAAVAKLPRKVSPAGPVSGMFSPLIVGPDPSPLLSQGMLLRGKKPRQVSAAAITLKEAALVKNAFTNTLVTSALEATQPSEPTTVSTEPLLLLPSPEEPGRSCPRFPPLNNFQLWSTPYSGEYLSSRAHITNQLYSNNFQLKSLHPDSISNCDIFSRYVSPAILPFVFSEGNPSMSPFLGSLVFFPLTPGCIEHKIFASAARAPITPMFCDRLWETGFQDSLAVQNMITLGALLGVRYTFHDHSEISTDLPTAYRSSNLPSARLAPKVVDQYILDEVTSGRFVHLGSSLPPIWLLPHSGLRIIPLGTVAKESSPLIPKPRRIISDYSSGGVSSINSRISPGHVSWLSNKYIAHQLILAGPDAEVTIIDICQAFTNLAIHPQDYRFSVVKWRDQYFVNTREAFGSSSAPSNWDIPARGLQHLLKSEGIKSLRNTDDYLLPSPAGRGLLEADIALRIFRESGFPISEQKLVLAKSTFIFNGLFWNLPVQLVRVPPGRLTRILDALSTVLLSSLANPPDAIFLRKLVGRLQSISVVIPGSKAHLQFLYRAISLVFHQNPRVPDLSVVFWNSDVHDELVWWQQKCLLDPSRNMVEVADLDHGPVDHACFTDASGSGIAAWDSTSGQHTFMDVPPAWVIDASLSQKRSRTSSALVEMAAIALLFTTVGPLWAPKSNVRVHCDNAAAVSCLIRSHSSVRPLALLIRFISDRCILLGIHISFVWIPGRTNIVADALSRRRLVDHLRNSWRIATIPLQALEDPFAVASVGCSSAP